MSENVNPVNLEPATIAERDMWRDKAQAALARVAELEADHDMWKSRAIFANENGGELEQKLRAAEAREAKLREALVEHNDLLRSAMQIAKREGVDGKISSTNWDAYYNRVAVVLKRHHDLTNQARAALTQETKP